MKFRINIYMGEGLLKEFDEAIKFKVNNSSLSKAGVGTPTPSRSSVVNTLIRNYIKDIKNNA